MKSVADLIANKNALIKRDNRGKITAASLSAAGVAVLAAAQAEAQGVDGFEDITSSVTSFERIGNGQVEFELENGQRFIANEGQYIIEGNQISVSQELVTIVGGSGINPTVIAVGVAGAALLVGALILLNSDDSSDSTATTTGSTTTTTTPTFTVTSDAATTATGTTGDDAFTVTNQTYSPGLTVDGDDGSDEVTLSGAATTAAGIDLSSQNIQLTDVESLVVSANGGAATTDTTTVNIAGEVSSLTVEVTGDGQIDVDNLGVAGATAATANFNNLDADQKANVTFSNDVAKGTVGLNSAGTAGSGAAKLAVSGASLTELTIASNTAANKIALTAVTSSVTKLIVSGTADLEFSGNDAGGTGSSGLSEIDATSASGKLSFDFDPSNVGTIQLGSNSDTITAIGDFGAGDTLDGGLGGDTLALSGASIATGTVTDIETVNVEAGSATIDYSLIDSDLTDLNVNVAETVTIIDFDSGNIDVSTTSASLEFEGSTGATTVDIDAPAITGTLALANTGVQTSVDVDFTGAATDVTLTSAGLASVNIRAGASTAVLYTTATGATDVDASDALGGITFTSGTGTVGIRGSSIADTFDFSAGTVTLDVNSLTELGDGYAATPSIGTNLAAAIAASEIESITGFDGDELDFDGVFGDSSAISLAAKVSNSGAFTATDFDEAADRIDSSGVFNAVFMDDTTGVGADYLLIENGGDIYAIEFGGGFGSESAATPTVTDIFL
jgi:hypothetical protein